MTKSLLDDLEVRRAQIGPRQMKDPHSREYAIQTLYSLKRYLESKSINERRLKEELSEIKEYRHWEVLGYASLDDYLKAETGLTAAEMLGKAKQAVIKAVCEKAREEGPVKNGGDRRSNQFDNCKTETKGGNDPTYLARRILTEDPETFERLESGDFRSVRAAAKHCGIVKDIPKRSVPIESPEAAIKALRDVFSDEALTRAIRDEQEQEIAPLSVQSLLDSLPIESRMELLRCLLRDPDAIPDDQSEFLEIAKETFLTLDHDHSLVFMEWANTVVWESAS